MKKFPLTALSVVIGVMASAGVMAQAMTKDAYKAGEAAIAADYTSGRATCDALSGNAKDICVAEVKGKQRVASADLEATYEPTAKHRYDALVAKATADYAIANEKCDDRAGNDKDVCVKEAKAAETRVKADAEAQLKTWEANRAASEKGAAADTQARAAGAAARHDAAVEKRDANYALAKEKCDSLASTEADRCLQDAKAKYAK